MPSKAHYTTDAVDDGHIVLKEEFVLNTYDVDCAKTDDRAFWDLCSYSEEIKVELVKNEELDLQFDLINVDPAIANALRRVLLAEVPTMAIEKVFIDQNTSLIQDEVLAHRLGLIPIKADPRLFEYRPADEPLDSVSLRHTLVFRLRVKCTKSAAMKETAATPEDLFENSSVYSKQLEWVPPAPVSEPGFVDRWSDPPRPVDTDILIAKLRPGQEIDVTCHCYKGIGSDHAKFSPVATASYRLLPVIKLLAPVEGDDADRLKKCFSDGVIGLVEERRHSGDPVMVAKVLDARRDACSRNVFRYPELAEKVHLSRNKRHFIFSVESTGALASATLVSMALDTLMSKCQTVIAALDKNLE